MKLPPPSSFLARIGDHVLFIQKVERLREREVLDASAGGGGTRGTQIRRQEKLILFLYGPKGTQMKQDAFLLFTWIT
jgi:hypothetical protein